ncbi:MAG: RDD family protein [Planctomycetes bacterium]|nr:RDD family protein [Planctomycetota bacterium]
MLRYCAYLFAAALRATSRRCVAGAVVATSVLFGLAGTEGADGETRQFGLTGSEGFVWIYDYKFDPDSGRSLLYIGVRDPKTRAFFVPAAMRGLVGRVHKATSAGRDLFLIFDEKGAHRRYRYEVVRRTSRRVRAQTEQPLPGGALPLAFVGHSLDEMLYAIVPREPAHAIAVDEIRRTRQEANDSKNENSSEVDETVDSEPIDVAARLGSAQFFAVRYSRSRWGLVCEMPEWFDRPEECYLVVDGDRRLHLLFAEDPAAPYQHAWYAENAWSSPNRVFDTSGYQINSVCASEDQIVVVGSIDAGSTRSIYASTFEGGQWVDQKPFVIDGAGRALSVTSFASTCVGGEIGLAVLGDGQGLLYGRWEINGGAPTEALLEVAGLGPGRKASMSWQTQSMAAFVLLGALLVFAFLRRGDSITRNAELPAQYAVAGYWRRLVSFVIDVAPIAIATNRLWMGPLDEWLTQYHEAQDEGGPVPPFSDELLIAWALCCVAFSTYCTFCEALFARTPGKVAVRCRVVDETGGRCGFSVILIRNLVRMIELFPLFQLWPTFILMLFTRNRQRLGDLLARTIVVQHVPLSQVQNMPPGNEPQQPDD